MAIKKTTMRNYNGTDWDELYPKTSAEQVVETASKRFTSDVEMENLKSKADKTVASNLADGLMSKADKIKLEGVEPGANAYTHPASHPASMITGLSTVSTSGNYNDLSSKPALGTVATRNTGTANGNVPIIGSDGKLDASIMPALAITDTFVVSTQAAMLALTAQIGDVCVRTDLSKSFILKAEPASTLANWQELLIPSSTVSSVAGKTGAVTLTKSDVGLANVPNESKAMLFANAALTGTPTAPTVSAATNNTQIATTAFVKTAVSDVSSSMPKVTVSSTQPTNPAKGDFWYEIV